METNFIHKTTVSGLFESKQIMALPMTDWSRVIAVRMLLLSYEIWQYEVFDNSIITPAHYDENASKMIYEK